MRPTKMKFAAFVAAALAPLAVAAAAPATAAVATPWLIATTLSICCA